MPFQWYSRTNDQNSISLLLDLILTFNQVWIGTAVAHGFLLEYWFQSTYSCLLFHLHRAVPVVGGERHGKNVLGVSYESSGGAAWLDLPQSKGSVPRSRSEIKGKQNSHREPWRSSISVKGGGGALLFFMYSRVEWTYLLSFAIPWLVLEQLLSDCLSGLWSYTIWSLNTVGVGSYTFCKSCSCYGQFSCEEEGRFVFLLRMFLIKHTFERLPNTNFTTGVCLRNQ